MIADLLEDWVGRVLLLGIAVCIGLLCLAGGWAIYQEATEPKAGTVTGKKYEPSYTTLQCAAYNGQGMCTVWVPVQHPECWRIDYENDGRHGDACVSAADFEWYEAGSRYPRSAS